MNDLYFGHGLRVNTKIVVIINTKGNSTDLYTQEEYPNLICVMFSSHKGHLRPIALKDIKHRNTDIFQKTNA